VAYRRAQSLTNTLLWVLALVITPPLTAQSEPVLHEYIAPPSAAESTRWVKERGLPKEIHTQDQRIQRPPFEEPTETSEMGPSAPARRRARVGLDRTTTHDGQLNYDATFNPSVVPFKRVTAADRVREDFTLSVRDPRLRPVKVAYRPIPPDRDAFWGSLQLQALPGKALPMPSVAPSAAIVSYRTRPEAKLRFFKDSADNFWVKSDRGGRLSVVLLMDAPRSYFSPQVPALLSAADVPEHRRPRLPRNVKTDAQRVLRHIGLRPGSLNQHLSRLVAYFRNFQARPLQRKSDNIYLDIAFTQRGVCRHRSLAFVITAQAVGIPARYVENEAHAFVEVYLPRHGWARIDLGGASVGLDVHAAQRKAVHRPKQDPFPRPSRFEGGYSQLRGAVSGLDKSQLKKKPAQERTRSLRRFDRSAKTQGRKARNLDRAPPGATPDKIATSGHMGNPKGTPPKITTQIVVFSSSRTLFRGDLLHVWGKVQAGKRGVGNLRVEVYLGRDRNSALMLGATVSDSRGAFLLRPTVPITLEVGRYRIYAATPGDTRHEASLSR